MKTYFKENRGLVLLNVALMLAVAFALALGFDLRSFVTPEAAAGLMLANAGGAMELKQLEEAMKKAFDEMQVGIRKAQDTAEKAREEVRMEGTLHGKTNEALTKISEDNRALADQFGGLRTQVLELAQKIAATPEASGTDEQTIAQMVAASEQYKVAASRGEMSAVQIKSLFHRGRKTAIVNAAGQNQPLVPDQRLGGIITPAEQRLVLRDIIPAARAGSNLIQFVQETAFTNNAGLQGDASPGGAEGENLAESAFTFALSNAAIATIGHSIPVSEQVLSDAALLEGHLGERMIYGVKLAEEVQFLRGSGTAGNISGINTLAAAFTGGNTNQTILDTFLRAIEQVSLSNYDADAFVLHPTNWYEAMRLKDTTGRYLFSDPQSMVAPRVWAKPVIPTATQTLNKFTCGAFRLGAQIWDLEDVTVRTGWVNGQFRQKMLTLRCDERVTLTVYRTTAFVYGDTTFAG